MTNGRHEYLLNFLLTNLYMSTSTPEGAPKSDHSGEETGKIGHKHRKSLGEYRATDLIATTRQFAEAIAIVFAAPGVDSVIPLEPKAYRQPPIVRGDILIPIEDLPPDERSKCHFAGYPVTSVGCVVETNDGADRRAEEMAKALLPHLTKQMDAAFLTCDKATALDNIYKMFTDDAGVILKLLNHELPSLGLEPVAGNRLEARNDNPHRKKRLAWFGEKVAPKLKPALHKYFMETILPRFDGKVHLLNSNGYVNDKGQPGETPSFRSATGEYEPLDDAKYKELQGQHQKSGRAAENVYVPTYLTHDFATLCRGGKGGGVKAFYNSDGEIDYHEARFESRSDGTYLVGNRAHRKWVPGGYAFVIRADSPNYLMKKDQIRVNRLPAPEDETKTA